ncbi:histidine phosphatase family protein [Psychroserpens sp. SPM9]|uniref:SixA phosphatase family protein n=1 Tax=Psychroserpens sp. SPM9 TaxID=2975598 RepID=UPI0021A86617|nr:histidine phosphatase family protein [Psychroserpens sp. SPM9]MDG5491454.1 histidine phosphatase family protein [Psychroserpens sp. SPM9]
MKTLILTRHAKSSWEYDVSDKERPLKKRGVNDAKLVSSAFKERLLSPETVFSSPANRALSTCKIFMNTLNIPETDIEIIPDLYDFGGEQVIRFLKKLDEDYKNVMIFGHNHAFTSICNIFGDKFIDNLPTSGLVVIDFNVNSWSDIKNGTTRFMIFPRDLK